MQKIFEVDTSGLAHECFPGRARKTCDAESWRSSVRCDRIARQVYLAIAFGGSFHSVRAGGANREWKYSVEQATESSKVLAQAPLLASVELR